MKKTLISLLALLGAVTLSRGAGLTVSSATGVSTNQAIWTPLNNKTFAQVTNWGNSGTNFTLDISGVTTPTYWPSFSATPNDTVYGYLMVDPNHDGGPGPDPGSTEVSLVGGRSVALVAGASARAGRIQVGSAGFPLRMFFQPALRADGGANQNVQSYSGLTEYPTWWSSNAVLFTHYPGIIGRWSSTNSVSGPEQKWSLEFPGDCPTIDTWTTNDISYFGQKFFYGVTASNSKFMGADFVGSLEGSWTNKLIAGTNAIYAQGKFAISQLNAPTTGPYFTNNAQDSIWLLANNNTDGASLRVGTLTALNGGVNAAGFIVNDSTVKVLGADIRLGSTTPVRFNSASDQSGSFDALIRRDSAGSINVSNNLTVVNIGSFTNGVASYSVNRTVTVNATGVTNGLTVCVQILGFTGTSVNFYDNLKTTAQSMGTITSPQTITLQPGGALTGTSCAASGTHSF